MLTIGSGIKRMSIYFVHRFILGWYRVEQRLDAINSKLDRLETDLEKAIDAGCMERQQNRVNVPADAITFETSKDEFDG